MWQMMLGDWMKNADILSPALQRDADLKKRKEQERGIGDQKQREYEIQKEFAQNGMRWKVEDARRAGLHPLFALGGSGASYSPQGVTIADPVDNNVPSGPDLSAMSQDLTRAMNSTRTGQERELAQIQLASARADLDGKTIDNQIRASQLKKLQAGPAFPGGDNFISGQGNSGLVKDQPLTRTATLPGGHAEGGAIGDIGWAKTSTGVVPVPSKDIKERIEDNFFHETSHFIRNNVMPNFGGGTAPPASALPKGATNWFWNPVRQEYQPEYPDRGYGRAKRMWTERRNY